MMNRINRTIEKAKSEGRLAFIGLLPIIPESMEKTLETARTIIDAGLDIAMVHIPNWFPWMEGGTLQKAARNPRHAGVTREDMFRFIRALRSEYPDLPIMDMTLFDTALTMGIEHFTDLSEAADVDGYDLPDYPLFQTNDKYGFYDWCLKHNRHLILDVSYEEAIAQKGTIEYELLSETCDKARGFMFVMNAPGGKSGSNEKLSDEQLSNAVNRVKSILREKGNSETSVSVVCGISSADDLEKVKKSGAESFMIGSAYVKMILDGKPLSDVSEYIKSISRMCAIKE